MNAHPTAVEIAEAVALENDRMLTLWRKSSDEWAKICRDTADDLNSAVRWCRVHKYIGYPITLAIGVAIGHFV